MDGGTVVAQEPTRLGRSAITLYTQQAQHIPVLSDVSYQHRTLRKPWVSYMGARPIHRTTLTLDRGRPKLDYISLYRHYFQGSPNLKGVRRPPTCPSMFTSQWDIGENDKTYFTTHSNDMFPPKTGETVKSMRQVQVQNRFNNTHGQKMMDITDNDTGPSYFTTYRISHDSLGKKLGTGVPHTRKCPPRFNIISGEVLMAPSTKSDFRRRSGNRILSEQRQRSNIYESFQLG